MRMASHLILHPAVHTTSRIYITHKFFHRDLHYSFCFHTYGFNVINANGSVKGIGSKNLACLIWKSSKNFIPRTLEIFWVKLNSELANSSLGLLRICHLICTLRHKRSHASVLSWQPVINISPIFVSGCWSQISFIPTRNVIKTI